MPVLESHVFDITRSIQPAVPPAFLLTAISLPIIALSRRLARAVARRRKLLALLSAC